MRKLIIAGMAVAMLAVIPAAASASTGVERCQVTTTVTAPSVTTATFKVFEPAGTKDSFDNFYTTDYKVTVTGDTFEGTGLITGYDAPSQGVPTFINGTFDRANNTVSYVARPADTDNHISWKLVNGATDGTTVNPALALDSQEGPSVGVNFKVTQPQYTTVVGATTTTTTEYKNHGEYVSKLGGGKIAAQACQGMPVVSTQGVL